LIVAVGGDGTILNTSSFLDDTIPLLGINSDPRRPGHGRNLSDQMMNIRWNSQHRCVYADGSHFKNLVDEIKMDMHVIYNFFSFIQRITINLQLDASNDYIKLYYNF
jgi:hypothetical protein